MDIPKVLVVDSEPREAREKRRRHGRPSACESLITALNKIVPSITCDRAAPVDGETAATRKFSDYTAALFAGSPLHFYDSCPQVDRVLTFTRSLGDSGMPCFGSCAGLQIATVVAGGKIGPKERQTELGIARAITPTRAGRDHPLLQGRPAAFDAPSIHGDEVKELPSGATLLAQSIRTQVQAAELQMGRSIFWGTQYHPEISLEEIALAIEDQADDAIQKGFAGTRDQLDRQLERFQTLDKRPDRLDLAWETGLDEQVTRFPARTVEMRNFLERFVLRPLRFEPSTVGNREG